MPQDSHQSPDQVANAATTEAPKSTPQTNSPSPQTTAAEPSGYKGDNPATAGPGQTTVHSNTPENALGRLNPSAPEDANVTPGSASVK